MLLSGERLYGRARLRASVRVVRPDRRVCRALWEPLHACLLPGRVRRGPPLARTVGGRGGGARGLDRGLLALAPGDGGGSARWAGGASPTTGQARGGGSTARRGRHDRERAAVPRSPGARSGR